MPAIIGGPINITSADGVVNFGDSLHSSPKSVGKSIGGSGGFNTGNFIWTFNGVNLTNTFDPDLIDQPQVANA